MPAHTVLISPPHTLDHDAHARKHETPKSFQMKYSCGVVVFVRLWLATLHRVKKLSVWEQKKTQNYWIEGSRQTGLGWEAQLVNKEEVLYRGIMIG